jgi:hypothetical protein
MTFCNCSGSPSVVNIFNFNGGGNATMGGGCNSPGGNMPGWGSYNGAGGMNDFKTSMFVGLLMALLGSFGSLQGLMQSLLGGGFQDPNNNPLSGNAYSQNFPGRSSRRGRFNGGNSGFPGGGGGRGSGGWDGGYMPQQYPGMDPNASPGEQRQSAVDWARSQLGVSERENPDIVRGYSQGRWEKWCANFVSTALERNGGSPWGHKASVSDIHQWAKRNGRVTNTPRPGDAVIFNHHIALVESVNPDGSITTIGGNERDAVRRATYRAGSRRIKAFVSTA